MGSACVCNPELLQKNSHFSFLMYHWDPPLLKDTMISPSNIESGASGIRSDHRRTTLQRCCCDWVQSTTLALQRRDRKQREIPLNLVVLGLLSWWRTVQAVVGEVRVHREHKYTPRQTRNHLLPIFGRYEFCTCVNANHEQCSVFTIKCPVGSRTGFGAHRPLMQIRDGVDTIMVVYAA